MTTALAKFGRLFRGLAIMGWRWVALVAAKPWAGRARERAAAYNDFFFAELGVSKAEVEAMVTARCAELGLIYTPEHQSVHYTAFAALAKSGFRPRRILELGTFRGEATLLLASLFPDAKVVTVDLPLDDPLLRNHAPTASEISIVDRRLAHPNIERQRLNTAFLWQMKEGDFDLIWCDAGHEFPEVAWDHFYCLSRLAPGGWLFSDDIRRVGDNVMHRWNPAFFHAETVVEYLSARMPQGFRYLLKREDPALYVVDRKYVAFLNRPKTSA